MKGTIITILILVIFYLMGGYFISGETKMCWASGCDDSFYKRSKGGQS